MIYSHRQHIYSYVLSFNFLINIVAIYQEITLCWCFFCGLQTSEVRTVWLSCDMSIDIMLGPDKLLSCHRREPTICTERIAYDLPRIYGIAVPITVTAMSRDRGIVPLRHCHLYMQIVGCLDKFDRQNQLQTTCNLSVSSVFSSNQEIHSHDIY